MINKIKIIFKIIFTSKWIFKKPSKKKVLLYNPKSLRFSTFFFSKNICEILDVRYESINIYVLFSTFLKFGINNFFNNYKKMYLSLVSPKLVFTAIDNDPSFYKLKQFYSKPVYMSVQNGLRNNEFYNLCKRYINNTKKKLLADYIFLFGENEKKRFSKIIKSEILCLGNVRNNYHAVKNIKIEKKIHSIMFVSGYKPRLNNLEEEKPIFDNLNKFCTKKKIKLTFCSKMSSKSSEFFFRKNLNAGNWKYLPQSGTANTYRNLNNQQMVVSIYSTLGFEALSKGKKCCFFNKHFPIEGNYVKYPKTGFFWTDKKRYYDFEKVMLRVINTSNKNWKKISMKYSNEILHYNSNNIKIKKIIKNILN